MFIDLVKIKIESGSGGNGAVAWRREKYVPKGGPAGGDGGKGGNIMLQADQSLSTLLEFKYKSVFRAENGENGKSKNCHGKNGDNLIIKVPVGTVVKDLSTETIIADLIEDQQMVLIAAGGRGGRGNSNFTTPTRQAPQFCEPGEPGIERELQLEIKLLADIGIIGLPNAGKSTFISAVSAAKPKIADYPFTTLIPNLGVVRDHDGNGVVFADIPGLIEGASDGAGLGHQFLRHVERTRLLLHIIDALEENPINNYSVINEELKKYSERLASLEQVIAINKIDAIHQDRVTEIKEILSKHNDNIFEISAVTGQGIKELKDTLLTKVKSIPKDINIIDLEEDYGAFDNDDSTFMIYKDKKNFIVDGGKVKRLVNVTDLRNNEAVYRLQNILKAMGVFESLVDAGAKNGDIVVIDNYEFEYYE